MTGVQADKTVNVDNAKAIDEVLANMTDQLGTKYRVKRKEQAVKIISESWRQTTIC